MTWAAGRWLRSPKSEEANKRRFEQGCKEWKNPNLLNPHQFPNRAVDLLVTTFAPQSDEAGGGMIRMTFL